LFFSLEECVETNNYVSIQTTPLPPILSIQQRDLKPRTHLTVKNGTPDKEVIRKIK